MQRSIFLEQLAREYYAASYQAAPSSATMLGIHSYDDQLGDFSRPALTDYLRRVKDFRTRLQRLDRAALSGPDHTDWQLLDSDLQVTILNLETIKDWERDPSFYVAPVIEGMRTLIVRDFAPLAERLWSLSGRLSAFKGLLATGRQNLANPPRVYVEVAIETVEGAIVFLEQAVPEAAKHAPDVGPRVMAAQQEALGACRAYQSFLRNDLLPRARGDFAVGRATFERLLHTADFIDLSAAEILAIGQRSFAQTKATLEQLAHQINPRKSWPELIEEGRQEHPAAADLLDTYRRAVTHLRAFVQDRNLVTIPSNEQLTVIDTPDFARSTTPYAAYLPPAPFEVSQKGEFWVTPVPLHATAAEQREWLQENSNFAIPGTALHEAYPGHHLQLVYSNDISGFVRKHVSSSLFAEGWAFYCEQLMREQGYIPEGIAGHDPRLFHLFLLKDQLWRDARIILAVGLHTQGMTVDQAVRLLVDEVKLEEGPARVEVHRYTQTPIQPLSYLLGKLEILKLREAYRGRPLLEFHDRLLDHGTIPFRLIREEMLGGAQAA